MDQLHRCGLGEFLVGQIAERDGEVAVVPDVADVAGPQPGKRQAVTCNGGDGAGSIAGAGWVPTDAAVTVLARRYSAVARDEPGGLIGGDRLAQQRRAA